MSTALHSQSNLRPYREHPDDDRPQHADRGVEGLSAHPQARAPAKRIPCNGRVHFGGARVDRPRAG